MHSPSATTICYCAGEAGLLQFRSGVKTVDEAEEKFSKLKDDVVAYLRSFTYILTVNITVHFAFLK